MGIGYNSSGMLEDQLAEAKSALRDVKEVLSSFSVPVEGTFRALTSLLFLSAMENDKINPSRVELMGALSKDTEISFIDEFAQILDVEEGQKLILLREKVESALRDYEDSLPSFAVALYQKRKKWILYQDGLMLIADAFGSAESIFPERPNNALVKPVFDRMIQPIIDLNEK